MNNNPGNRFLDKNAVPSSAEIEELLGPEAAGRLEKLENFLQAGYTVSRELKFPFGNSYGWGYKYSHKSKLLVYVFFEKNFFTATITIGKGEVSRLNQELEHMLPKTRKLWENRYPCGEGGWVHYRVENGPELQDVQKLIAIKKKPRPR